MFKTTTFNKRSKRPKVLHSLVVATEILLLRDRFLGHPQNPKLHPPSESVIEKTRNSVNSICDMSRFEKLLTPRALMLIESCSEKIEEIDQNFKNEKVHAVSNI